MDTSSLHVKTCQSFYSTIYVMNVHITLLPTLRKLISVNAHVPKINFRRSSYAIKWETHCTSGKVAPPIIYVVKSNFCKVLNFPGYPWLTLGCGVCIAFDTPAWNVKHGQTGKHNKMDFYQFLNVHRSHGVISLYVIESLHSSVNLHFDNEH